MSIPPWDEKAVLGGSQESKSGLFRNGGMQSDAVEESPMMRSVAVRSAPLPSLSRAGPLGETKVLGFGKPGPLGIARPKSGGLRSSSAQSFGSSDPFLMKQEWSGAATKSTWNVRGEDLEPVPEDFPLERTHRTIPNVDAVTVASRISEALRKHSIEAEFDCQKAKAKCKTNDFVSFRIRLYAGGDGGMPVVVEVQRRCGSASSFMKSCRAILDAAEGKDSLSAQQTSRKMPPFNKPIGQMKCLANALPQLATTAAEDAAYALDNVVEMLRSKQRDTNILGLENLCSLTDPIKTTPNVAFRVSKCVVLGDERYDLREEIRVLTERDIFIPDFEQDEGPSDHIDQLRHLALSVLSNALVMCVNEGCLAAAVKEQKWFADYLIPSLVDEVRRAETNACNACCAANCLSSLVSCSDVALELIIHNGGKVALQEAHNFAEARNALLAEYTSRCLKTLRDVPVTAA